MRRRQFIQSLCATLPVFSFDQLIAGLPLGVQFVNVAREAGLSAKTIFGGEQKNKFLLETTGCGCAFFDYDNDGWLDIFLVNGTRFEADGRPARHPSAASTRTIATALSPMSPLKAGVARTGWGQGVASATTTTMGTTTYSSAIGAIAFCGTTWQRQVHRRRPKGRRHNRSRQRASPLEHRLRVRGL